MDRNYESLAKVHTRSVDAKKGYHKMMEKADPAFRPVAQDFANLHAVHAERIATMMRKVGEEPDTDGSFMATVNEAVVTLRSWFDDIDHDVMGQVKTGEKMVLGAFDDAIEDPDAAAFTHDLGEMKGDLTALLARHAPAD